MMGKIIIYDDEPLIVEQLKTGIRKVDLIPVEFSQLNILRAYIKAEENWTDIQALVFDLAQATEAESGDNDYAIIEDILICYETRRVPILIHSAFAEQVDKLQNLPGVFLYKKGHDAIRNIRRDLDIMKKSGFLDLFAEGPLLNDQVRLIKERIGIIDEATIKSLLHGEYVNIFRSNLSIMEELNQILVQNERPEEACFNRFMKPAVDRITS